MKKNLLYVFLAFFIGGNAMAQKMESILYNKTDRNTTAKAQAIPYAKAEGDTVWSDNFTTAANWVAGNLAGHTGGAWAIVNQMPASLVAQAPTYGFPTAMNSTSGGNFALINSDAAGASATQNATLTTVNAIDLSAYGTTSISLKFKEIYRHFQESFFVAVSNDNGANWTEFQVNTPAEVPVNTNSGDPDIETVNITSVLAGGSWSANVKLRFRYQGAYDWFWGIDDVQLVETLLNDIKVTRFYDGTSATTTARLDYRRVPVSQVAFPGITFGANVLNNGGNNQAAVALKATSGTYNQTGSALSINAGSSDSVAITTPFMLPAAVSTSTVNITTTITGVDGDASNNVSSFDISRHANQYARDNDIVTGSITNISSQPGLALKIGNEFEVFNDMLIGGASVRLVNQPTAVGQEIGVEIRVLNAAGDDYDFIAESDPYLIQATDLNTFVYIPFNAPALVNAGDIMLVLAKHNGGTQEVAFGLAQSTFDGSVVGYTAVPAVFTLASPKAVMVRAVEQIGAGLNEASNLPSFNIFPNPASDKVTLSLGDFKNDASVTISDLSGKTVITKEISKVNGKSLVTIETQELNSGVYLVNVTLDGATSTKKLTIK